MIRQICQRAFNAARDFLHNQSGSIVIYTGAFMAVGIGGAALSIDIGRIVLLKTQMQNRADAGALAGAAQLDAQSGALDRAHAIAYDSMAAFLTAGADQGEATVWYTKFYKPAADYITRGDETTDDVAARFIEVVMQRRTLSFFYAPALNIMTGQDASSYTELGARAVGMSDPFICKAQPLMICNPLEDDDPFTADALPDNTYVGRGIALKQGIQGGGTWTAGNFGLLELPGDASYAGGGGAQAVAAALSAEEPKGCYGYSIVTAPGSMTVSVSDAINTRFGMPTSDPTVLPAPNVMNYPKDINMQAAMAAGTPLQDMILGDGGWDLEGYWTQNHPGVTRPTILDGATRYIVYLFEQDVTFWKKKGGKTVRIVLSQAEIDTGNWDEIVPSTYDAAAAVLPEYPANPDDNWRDGYPPPGQTVASIGYERRILRVNIMNCVNQGVQGKGDYQSENGYMEIFLTEQSDEPSGGAGIYGEFIRKLDPRISLEFHGNVRLVE